MVGRGAWSGGTLTSGGNCFASFSIAGDATVFGDPILPTSPSTLFDCTGPWDEGVTAAFCFSEDSGSFDTEFLNERVKGEGEHGRPEFCFCCCSIVGVGVEGVVAAVDVVVVGVAGSSILDVGAVDGDVAVEFGVVLAVSVTILGDDERGPIWGFLRGGGGGGGGRREEGVVGDEGVGVGTGLSSIEWRL